MGFPRTGYPGWVLAAFILTASSPNGRGDQAVSVIGQPSSDFYNAQGNPVRLEWVLDRTTVAEDEDLVATLLITGITNPLDVVRPDLRKLDAFESRFVISDVAGPKPAENAKEVRFTYQLRPRRRTVDRVPTLPFHYYNPAASKVGKQQFPMTTAREVRIVVTGPRLKSDAAAIPLGEPGWLLSYTPQPVSLARPPFHSWWAWLLIALAGPSAALMWFFAWRRVYPDGARLARKRRSRAAHRAFHALRHAGRAPEPSAAVAAAVLGYLRARFPFSEEVATPSEVGATLAELGVERTVVEGVVEFFRAADAERFGPGSGGGDSLVADATALILRLEAA